MESYNCKQDCSIFPSLVVWLHASLCRRHLKLTSKATIFTLWYGATSTLGEPLLSSAILSSPFLHILRFTFMKSRVNWNFSAGILLISWSSFFVTDVPILSSRRRYWDQMPGSIAFLSARAISFPAPRPPPPSLLYMHVSVLFVCVRVVCIVWSVCE